MAYYSRHNENPTSTPPDYLQRASSAKNGNFSQNQDVEMLDLPAPLLRGNKCMNASLLAGSKFRSQSRFPFSSNYRGSREREEKRNSRGIFDSRREKALDRGPRTNASRVTRSFFSTLTSPSKPDPTTRLKYFITYLNADSLFESFLSRFLQSLGGLLFFSSRENKSCAWTLRFGRILFNSRFFWCSSLRENDSNLGSIEIPINAPDICSRARQPTGKQDLINARKWLSFCHNAAWIRAIVFPPIEHETLHCHGAFHCRNVTGELSFDMPERASKKKMKLGEDDENYVWMIGLWLVWEIFKMAISCMILSKSHESNIERY